MAKIFLELMSNLSRIYNSAVCLPTDQPGSLQSLAYPYQNISDYPTPGQCLRGEPDLERLIKRTDLNPDQLKWIWRSWHDFVGPSMKNEFSDFNRLENLAAKMNGYENMGDIWKGELEISNLENTVFNLYEEIRPLYILLHAVVRHKLLLKYGPLEIDPLGPIPIHLLGNMWGQDWSKLIDIFLPPNEMIDLDKRIEKKKWKIKDLVLQAEDMYTSMGLYPMPESFWNHSIFEQNENLTICHGTAAFMYRKDDVRMLMCGKVDMENFYVIHHEIGHLQYYLAYQNQSSIFQSGANSAMHESIGDSIMHGVLSPSHLHRLNLITDEELIDPKTDFYLLLMQALAKIPEIPFSLITDKYRWDIFSGYIDKDHYNEAYWMLNKELRGIVPPERRGEEFFDAAGKFHLSDNTPYIRYFLSSILQMEIFKGLCEISLYGKTQGDDDYQENNIFPLHKCDIYGSKKCGRHLLDMMQQGSSIPWVDALDILIGKRKLSAKPLLEYYKPIYDWLTRYVKNNNVPIGW
nr:angiotensin-converting enzyme-like protein Ace3 [Onthophagus taurus]